MDLGDQIVMLERALQDLVRKWERFFAGDIRVPPHGDRERIARRLRMLAERPSRRREERFRLEQLQHRFMTYSQNWERMLREREEGRGRSVTMVRAAREAGTEEPTNVPSPVSVEETAERGLFDRYVSAKKQAGLHVGVDREVFEAQLAAKREKLEAQLGHKVRFDVLIEGGKVKLAARKVRSEADSE